MIIKAYYTRVMNGERLSGIIYHRLVGTDYGTPEKASWLDTGDPGEKSPGADGILVGAELRDIMPAFTAQAVSSSIYRRSISASES